MPGVDESKPFVALNLAIVTISDTRTTADDASGDTLAERAAAAGHKIAARRIVKDDRAAIAERLRALLADPGVDVILATGGTGVTGRDVTPEACAEVWDKEIPGFGELFRWLSYATVGTATIQSRACAGVAQGKYLFALPGSPSACRQAWDEILRFQLDVRYKPCNFAMLLPRLRER